MLQPYGKSGVLVLCQVGWRERLLGTSTKLGLKVLMSQAVDSTWHERWVPAVLFQKKAAIMWKPFMDNHMGAHINTVKSAWRYILRCHATHMTGDHTIHCTLLNIFLRLHVRHKTLIHSASIWIQILASFGTSKWKMRMKVTQRQTFKRNNWDI
jgi:hypothetical protein